MDDDNDGEKDDEEDNDGAALRDQTEVHLYGSIFSKKLVQICDLWKKTKRRIGICRENV